MSGYNFKKSVSRYQFIIILLLLIFAVFTFYKYISFDDNNSDFLLNVINYGADPTGKKDSSSSIQKAIDEASTKGGIVVFPPGEYLINKTLNIIHPEQKAVKLLGLSANNSYYGIDTKDTRSVTLTRKKNTNHDLILAEGRGLTIENIVFDGKGSRGNGLIIERGFELRIKNCHFYNIQGYAIKGYSLQNATIEDNHFNKSGSDYAPVLYLGGNQNGVSNTVNINNNHFERNFGTDVSIATSDDEFDYAEFIFFSGAHFESTDDTGGIIKSKPLLEIGKVRGVEIINSFFYGGNAPHIQTVDDFAKGISISNTFFLGDRTIGYVWQAKTKYKKGDFIIPSNRNGYIYIAKNTGVSGTKEPNFITTDNIYDNTVMWDVYSPTINNEQNVGNKDAPNILVELNKGQGISIIGCQFSNANKEYIYVDPKVKQFYSIGNTFLKETD
ncbi:glycosyl hydrolase family 28-related protein [Niallia sp. Marseille-Q9988]